LSESGHPAMTQDALVSSYGGESMAHMRYLIFADIAEKEGFKNVARLFRAIAFAEQVHARNHYQRLGFYFQFYELWQGCLSRLSYHRGHVS